MLDYIRITGATEITQRLGNICHLPPSKRLSFTASHCMLGFYSSLWLFSSDHVGFELKSALRRRKLLSSKASSSLSKLKMYRHPSDTCTCPRKIIIINIYLSICLTVRRRLFLLAYQVEKYISHVSRPCFDVPSPLFLRWWG